MLGRGENPYHPERATDATRRAYAAEQRRRVVQKWRDRVESGEITRRAHADLVRELRLDVDDARAPFPPRNPYRICPCHRAPMGMGEVEVPHGLAWVAKEYGPE